MNEFNLNFYKGKKVLVTGHTGFKGTWLCRILQELGAEVTGYSQKPPTDPSIFTLTDLESQIHSVIGDIRDLEHMIQVFKETQPEIVFHLAAQPIVRESYKNPVNTYETNVMGTVNVLEAVRQCGSVRSFLNVTTDKVYKNNEWEWGYRETDELDGYDPYSNSKSCSELVTHSYEKSFLKDMDIAVSTARAGNVIGGGDFAADRIIPDCIKALESGAAINIRSPKAIRPWQHVLEPLSGYMLLAQKMWSDPTRYCEGWNFGPRAESISTVWDVATKVVNNYGSGELRDLSDPHALHEAKLLMLDISKAKFRLGWEPKMNIEQTVELTVDWYKRYREEEVYDVCVDQIVNFIQK